MESSEVIFVKNSESNGTGNMKTEDNDDCKVLQDQVIENLQKPNVPNANIPEHIIICLDICHDNQNYLYRFGDGTTFTPINMMKRILEFFLHSKLAINRNTQFSLLILKDNDAYWAQNFTNNIKDIISAMEYLTPEESTTESFDFNKVIEIIQQNVSIPEYRLGQSVQPPLYVVRMIVLYGRSNCVPQMPQDEPYFNFLKKNLYFYIDILYAHQEECSLHKCEEVYDSLQDLDNGYSYVFEVSKNATKIHECIAKLLAHPLQRTLQKNTNYEFGTR